MTRQHVDELYDRLLKLKAKREFLFTGRGEHDSGQFDGGEEPLFGQAFARGEIFQFLDLDCQK